MTPDTEPKGMLPPSVMPWMRGVMLLGAGYHLLWGYFMVSSWKSIGFWLSQNDQAPYYVVFYLGIGVLLTAVILFLGTLYPRQLWILIGLVPLLKIADAAACWLALMQQSSTKKFYFYLIMNNGIWIPLLIAITIRAFRARKARA